MSAAGPSLPMEAAPEVPAGAPVPSGWEADGAGEPSEVRLLRALDGEARLLETLRSVLHAQRAAVATDDLEALERSVYDAQRVLGTLGEARKRRRALLSLVAGRPDLAIGELDRALGARFTPELRGARERLQADAGRLKRDLAINRKILESASETGQGFLRLLQGAGARPATYGPDASTPGSSGGGALLNRTI